MIKNILLILIIGVIIFSTISCTTAKSELKKDSEMIELGAEDLLKDKDDRLVLLQQKCYTCHSVTTKSHDEIIAPPMVAVVRRYKMSYNTKEAFVKAVTNWVLNPTKENALMFGAVQQFNVMPKQPFEKEEITKIAEYIFENELEQPIWFESHFKNQHPNGMGMRQENGNSMGNN